MKGSATYKPNSSPMKRYLTSPESDLDAIRQKQRISTDIPSGLPVHPKRFGESTATVRDGTELRCKLHSHSLPALTH